MAGLSSGHIHHQPGLPHPATSVTGGPVTPVTGRAVLIRQHRQQYLRLAAKPARPVSMPGSLVVARRTLALAGLSPHDLLDFRRAQAAPFRLGGAWARHRARYMRAAGPGGHGRAGLDGLGVADRAQR